MSGGQGRSVHLHVEVYLLGFAGVDVEVIAGGYLNPLGIPVEFYLQGTAQALAGRVLISNFCFSTCLPRALSNRPKGVAAGHDQDLGLDGLVHPDAARDLAWSQNRARLWGSVGIRRVHQGGLDSLPRSSGDGLLLSGHRTGHVKPCWSPGSWHSRGERPDCGWAPC